MRHPIMVGTDKTRHDATRIIVSVDSRVFVVGCLVGEAACKVVQAMMNQCRNGSGDLWAEKVIYPKQSARFAKGAEQKVHCLIEEVTPVHNKVQRAQSIIGRMAMKKVIFPSSIGPEGHRRC